MTGGYIAGGIILGFTLGVCWVTFMVNRHGGPRW